MSVAFAKLEGRTFRMCVFNGYGIYVVHLLVGFQYSIAAFRDMTEIYDSDIVFCF